MNIANVLWSLSSLNSLSIFINFHLIAFGNKSMSCNKNKEKYVSTLYFTNPYPPINGVRPKQASCRVVKRQFCQE